MGHLYQSLYKDQGISQKRGKKECKSLTKKGMYCVMLSFGYSTATVIMNSQWLCSNMHCTRPTKEKGSQYSRMDQGGIHEFLQLLEELLAVDGWKDRKNHIALAM